MSRRIAVTRPRIRPADVTGDAFLDFFDCDDDFNCFEPAACPPGTTADFNDDGFVAAFQAGC